MTDLLVIITHGSEKAGISHVIMGRDHHGPTRRCCHSSTPGEADHCFEALCLKYSLNTLQEQSN